MFGFGADGDDSGGISFFFLKTEKLTIIYGYSASSQVPLGHTSDQDPVNMDQSSSFWHNHFIPKGFKLEIN